MERAGSVVDLLWVHTGDRAEQRAYTVLGDTGAEETSVTWRQLDVRVRAVAAVLVENGLAGGRALLVYPPGLDYVIAFLACLAAGVTAVPAVPPRNRRSLPRFTAIVADADLSAFLTTAELSDRVRAFLGNEPPASLPWLATDEISLDAANAWRRVDLGGETLAFLQYTSGSTGDPKGVMLSHGNLLANQRMIRTAFRTGPASVVASWLPLYHDMGLIGAVLHPLFLGVPCVLMSPAHFLQRPVRWLEAISRYRATVSGGPDFAYDLCARKVSDEQKHGLDLSSWKVAFNGAEPISAVTLKRFTEAFAPCGFRAEAFHPCYGLAEATLLVSGTRRGETYEAAELDAAALEEHRIAEPVATTAESPRRWLVGSGGVPGDVEVAIVDPGTATRCDGRVGEIWVAADSVGQGYWNRPEESRETFHAELPGSPARYLRTGDLGFLRAGELFVTGRIKDLIILRGRNLYPQDVERTVGECRPELRPGGGAAFAVESVSGEALVVVQEVARDSSAGPSRHAELLRAIRKAVVEEFDVPVAAIVLIRPSTLAKTSSGKVRRRATKAAYQRRELAVVARWPGEGLSLQRDFVPPVRPLERLAARLFGEVLGVDAVGLHDDFFELGGDSLKSNELLAQLRDSLGVELAPESLFETPTVALLAERIDTQPGAAPSLGPLPAEAKGELSFAQRRLWFLHQLDPKNPVHNIAAAVRVRGELAAPVLARALSEVVRRHEVLSAGFATEDDRVFQVYSKPRPLPLPVVDLGGLPAAPRRAEERRLARRQGRRPFDLARPPFLRAALLRTSGTEAVLTLTMHHIVSDGASLEVLLREMGALYEAFRDGRPSPLRELRVQYADYAVWQRHRYEEGLKESLGYWKEKLGDAPALLALPSDRPRPAVQSFRGAHSWDELPAPLGEAVKALGRGAGTTLFMTLLAAYKTLLYRHTGLRDLAVGSPVAGRRRSELRDLIGFFVNTLVLRTGVDGSSTFSELLDRVRRTAVEAYAHQDMPFEKLVDELGPERNLSGSPLFRVMLVLQNAPLGRQRIGELELEPREVDNGTARFDLSLSLAETDAGLLGIWKYSTDLFDETTIRRLQAHLKTLLRHAAERPATRLDELPLLTAGERRQVVGEWNDTAVSHPPGESLHGWIEAQAVATPRAVAVEFEGATLSYGELDARSNQLAHHLLEQGAGRGTRVGIAMERSLELMVALLGVLKAGAAYVPLDPTYPRERLLFLAEDSRVPVLLTQEHLLRGALGEALTEKDVRTVLLDRDAPVLGRAPRTSPEIRVEPLDLAYVIYTSGSTGRPKGAMVPHRGIVNRLLWMQSAYGLTPQDRVMQKTPMSFDVSVWEFFWPLMTGARLVLARPEGHRDPAYLVDLIVGRGITTMHFVPSMLQVFLEEPRVESCTSLKRVIASGEALPGELRDRFLHRAGAGLHNLYGPTEASVDVTFQACAAEAGRPVVSIGRPIANTSIRLVDPRFRPVPVGVAGELLIGGVNLARGYLDRPALTARTFVPDPFERDTAGGRVYRTGDLARFLADGRVEYLGRIDNQVKVRGLRIELGEIEATFLRQTGVHEAAVVVHGQGGAKATLVAYLTGEGDAVLDVDALRERLLDELPEHMVPRSIGVLESMPLTPNGKLDRGALARRDLPTAGEPARRAAAPRTPLEAWLTERWAKVLGLTEVGVDDNFFELGGDSVQGALLINRIQADLGDVVYVMALFDAPTIAEMARYLERTYPAARRIAGRRTAGPSPTPAGSFADAVGEMQRFLASQRSAPARSEATPVRKAGRGSPIFLLSPFRSGSTLLRVMLGGHPDLFAPPELELLGFATAGERRETLSGRRSFAREGLLRALMGAFACSAEEAQTRLLAWEEEDLPIPDLYEALQAQIAPRRLVDKTPSYALEAAALERAEAWFERPLYVHLVRHPQATVRSFVKARMEQVYPTPFAAGRQAELFWWISHRNVLDFLAGVPPERQVRVSFEDLVRRPEGTLGELARFLDLDYDPRMADPYGEDGGDRMIDGIRPESRMMGDPKFHQHRGVDAAVAAEWRRDTEPLELSGATWELAAALSYERPPRSRRGGVEPVLSFAQERLWVLDQLQGQGATYNMPGVVRLAGRLDAAALTATFREVLRRHQVLRTAYPKLRGRPMVVLFPPEAEPVARVDLSTVGEVAARREAERRIRSEARRPFDLQEGPLVRLVLWRLRREEHLLLVNLHHIVSDGWSMGVLMREVAALYGALAAGAASTLPELPIQYAEAAARQRRDLGDGRLAASLGYWRSRLKAPLPPEVPTDRPRPELGSPHGSWLELTLPAAVAEELRGLARRRGTTLFVVLVSALKVLLYRLTGHPDVVLGTPIAGRNRPELEGLVGLFVNTLVLRTDLGGEPGFPEVLDRVHRTVVEAQAHQDVPFERLVEELGVERRVGHNPLFQVLFVLQNTPQPALELPGLVLETREVETGRAKFDLSFAVFETEAGLRLQLSYRTGLFEATTADFLLRGFAGMLEAVAADPERCPEAGASPLRPAAAPPMPAPRRPVAPMAGVAELERRLLAVWQEVLEREQVGSHDNFFDLGGHSLAAIRVHSRLRQLFGERLTVLDLFRHPTVHDQARALAALSREVEKPRPAAARRTRAGRAIAIVGMAGRFPGARDVGEFWRNLEEGKETLTRFTRQELLDDGVDEVLLDDPAYVPVRGVLDGVELFDAAFFGMTPREAALTDPQHRLFLETAWHALEDAGYDAETWPGRIGVWGGSLLSTYLLFHVAPRVARGPDAWQAAVVNDKDTLATRVSYKLGLRGPSFTVQSACSTSLVAVYEACESLRRGHCDLALAGGVAVRMPRRSGYLYQKGDIRSPDGHCRAYDARAAGTVFGDGVGIVVLKRLADAVADGDVIHAVIRGAAVNNDGATKVGFTAPGIEGQAEVIAQALADARVDADTVSYVEGHGTGTALGDPIEVAALTQAFRAHTERVGFCGLGSVKTNLGHLDTAAGVAGLIKTAQALRHAVLPPSLHFEEPPPEIDFAASPFYVNAERRDWPAEEGAPRRAGLSAFGIGGTNVHVVLEEAPPPSPSPEALRPYQLLTLSAKTPTALAAVAQRLAAHLEAHPDENLADVAFTLQVGRRALEHRRVILCRDAKEAVLAARQPGGTTVAAGHRPVTFLFPGQGSQHAGMARQLYDAEPVFRRELDACLKGLEPFLDADLRSLLLEAPEDGVDERLRQTSVAQAALFAVEHALARLWISWGVEPEVLLGHSIGEYVAATLSGVFELPEALELVALRGRLMEATAPGAMLSVELREKEVLALLAEAPYAALRVAAVNEPGRSVVSGPCEDVDRLAADLTGRGVGSRRLHTSHAFHSPQMEPAVEPFAVRLRQVTFAVPRIPWISNVTGKEILPSEATDPGYWTAHLLSTVRFADGLGELLREPRRVLLEVGPGTVLTASAGRHPETGPEHLLASSMGHPRDPRHGDGFLLLDAAARLWGAGVRLDWSAFHGTERRRRVSLPGYPFERTQHWIEAAEAATTAPVDGFIEFDDAEVERLRLAEREIEDRLAIRDLQAYEGLDELTDRLCTTYLCEYLAGGGLELRRGFAMSRDELKRNLGLRPQYEKFFSWMLATLAQDGWLRLSGDMLTVCRDPETDGVPLTEQKLELAARYPDFRDFLDFLEHCVTHYASALSGKTLGVSVLYPDGRSDLVERVYESTEGFRFAKIYHLLLRELLARLVETGPPRRLKILEIGAGNGFLTKILGRAFAGHDVEYHFTDLGRSLVLRAERQAEELGLQNVRFATFDATADPASQGYAPGDFDVVLGLNVVHVTPYLVKTLKNLRTLLRPRGVLLLLETVRAARWDQMTWGLAEGWWNFDDELRSDSPLAEVETWEGAFREAGFENVHGFPETPERRRRIDFGFLVGQQSAAVRPSSPAVPMPVVSAAVKGEHHAPEGPLEETVAAVFQEQLGVEGLDVEESFFELGGDSLIALRIVSRLEKRFTIDLSVSDLFEQHTVRALAEEIEERLIQKVETLSDDEAEHLMTSLLVSS